HATRNTQHATRNTQHATRGLTLESLEGRRVLAATADIVFIIDESKSAAPVDDDFQKDGESIQFWLHDMVPKLESKLVARGITGNRYGLVGFGYTSPGSRAFNVGPTDSDPLFGDPDEMLAATSNFYNRGGNEDGWEGLARAVNLRDSQYDFRPEAAVQFILITDEFRNETEVEGLPVRASAIANEGLFELASQLHASNLDTLGPMDLLEDAVLTFIGDAYVDGVRDEWPELGSDEIIGVDVHILDNVNVDKNSADPADDVLAQTVDDDVAFFRVDSTNGIYVDHRIEADVEKYFKFQDFPDPTTYQDWRNGLAADTDYEPLMVTGSAQYSMLAWESRGTVWDFEYFNQRFDEDLINGCDPAQQSPSCAPWTDKPEVDAFTNVVIDDIFEKFRLQILDFDDSGHVDLQADFPVFFDAAVSMIDPSIPDADARVFDLDNDGNFVDVVAAQIDVNDIAVLVTLFGTQFGDSNLDFQFNSSDFVAVFGANEYEDSDSTTDPGSPLVNNSTWIEGDWSGDFDFDSGDFVIVFTAGVYEVGYADVDGDGQYDFLPIWVDISTISPMTFDGVVSWYQPNWGDPV
ncbi:vWA domain-containing protein, partial [Planctomycetota bacterium]